MMGWITCRQRAEEDLIEIWCYIARDNERAADRLLAEIERACATLADAPTLGRARPELLDQLRSFAVGSHILFYLPHEGGIELLRVLHGARDFDTAFPE